MSDRYILDAQGEPVPCEDLLTWARWYEGGIEKRRVARTTIGEVEVSTVFLALDHSFCEGPPILYETMVFGGPLDQELDRYSTRSEAEAGHEKWVRMVQEATA